jgi:hypothetical protein
LSLEDTSKRAKRASNRRNKKLAAQGTTAAEEQIKRNKALQLRDASAGLSAAQQRARTAPSIKSVGTDSLKTGDAPEEVTNDSGYGTHMEHPGHKCGTDGCKAMFHLSSTLDTHKSLYHGPADQLFG